MGKNEKEAIILGALLHDIGKFVQRSQENPASQRHTQWGVQWYQDNLSEKLTPFFSNDEKELIVSAINNHHDGEPFVSLSDAISAGMDRIELDNEEKGDPFTSRLISIFSTVSISNKPKKDMYHKLSALCANNLEDTVFPIVEKECDPGEYKKLYDEFNKKMKDIDFTELTPCKVIERMYFALWKYTWCIPSAAYVHEPDVSFFDHSKTTAAITGCLYDYKQENPVNNVTIESPAFQLIGGDISGIQSFIFDVLTQEGKVAKRLRARSLYVQLISEVATHKIVHAFKMPLCNVLSSAGGNFYILLPNTMDIEQKLNKLQEEFDKWTYEKFKGEIYLSLAWIKASGEDLFKFDNVLEKLKKVHRDKKYVPYHSQLISGSSWQQSKFVFKEIIEGDEKACVSCHKNPIENEKEKCCTQCSSDAKIGQQLPYTKYIAFFNNKNSGFPIFDNYSFELLEEPVKDSSAYSVIALNNPACIGFKYLANHIPTAKNVSCKKPEHEHKEADPAFFDCIASVSSGDSLLGYVKADVDNMGKIFRDGFENTKPSISRFASLSRMLETFFAGYLQGRLENDFKELYTIFSGGDDFFIVGPWNKAIDFVREMRDKFREFTAENPDFTFSSSIILAKPHEPISYCAEYAEQELKVAKKQPDKDSVRVFNQTFRWDELGKVVSEAETVIKWLKEPPIVSRKLIHSFHIYGEMFQEWRNSGGIKYLKFIPLLAYDINRNLTKKEQEEAYNWAVNLSPTIQKDVEKDNLPYLRAIMEYVLTYTRGG